MPERYRPEEDPLSEQEFYRRLVRNDAERMGNNPDLAEAMFHQESGTKGPTATSNAGAMGLMQVMPNTAREMGIDPKTLYDPQVSSYAGNKYIAKIRAEHPDFTEQEIAQAYNGGPNRMARYKAGRLPQGLPKETRNYGPQVMGRMQSIKSRQVTPPKPLKPDQLHKIEANAITSPDTAVEQPDTTDTPTDPPPDAPDTTTGSSAVGTAQAKPASKSPYDDPDYVFPETLPTHGYGMPDMRKQVELPDPALSEFEFNKRVAANAVAQRRAENAAKLGTDYYGPPTGGGEGPPVAPGAPTSDEEYEQASQQIGPPTTPGSAVPQGAPTSDQEYEQASQQQAQQAVLAQQEPYGPPTTPGIATLPPVPQGMPRTSDEEYERETQKQAAAKQSWWEKAPANVGSAAAGVVGSLLGNVNKGARYLPQVAALEDWATKKASDLAGRQMPTPQEAFDKLKAIDTRQADIDPSTSGKLFRAAGGGVLQLGLSALMPEGEVALVVATAAQQDWVNDPKGALMETALALPFARALGMTAKTMAPLIARMGPGFVNTIGKRAVNMGSQAVVAEIYGTTRAMVGQMMEGQTPNMTAASQQALPGAVQGGIFGLAQKLPLKEAATGLNKTPSTTGEDIKGERIASEGVRPRPQPLELGPPQGGVAPQGGGPPPPAAGAAGVAVAGQPAGQIDVRSTVRQGGPKPDVPQTQVVQGPDTVRQTTQAYLDAFVKLAATPAEAQARQAQVGQLAQLLESNPNSEGGRRFLAKIKQDVDTGGGLSQGQLQGQALPIGAQQLGEQGIPLGQPQQGAPPEEGLTPRQARTAYLQQELQDLQIQSKKAKSAGEVAAIDQRIRENRAEFGPLDKAEGELKKVAAQEKAAAREKLWQEELQRRQDAQEQQRREGELSTAAVGEAKTRQYLQPKFEAMAKEAVGGFPDEGNLATGFWDQKGNWADFSRLSPPEFEALKNHMQDLHQSILEPVPGEVMERLPFEHAQKAARSVRDVLQRMDAFEKATGQPTLPLDTALPRAPGAEVPAELPAGVPEGQGALEFRTQPEQRLEEKYGHARLSWEAAPGTGTGELPGYHTAPAREQLQFTKDIHEATKPVMGEIYKALEIPYDGTEISRSVWEGKVNPSGQDSIFFAHGDPIPEQIKSVEAALAIRGKALNQDAMAYHILSEAKTPADVGAGVIDIGRGLNKLEMQKLDRVLTERLGEGQYALIGNADGATILNFGGVPKFQSELETLSKGDSHLWTKAEQSVLGWAKSHSDVFNADQYDAKIKGVTSEDQGHLPKERAQSIESLSADLTSRVQGVYEKYARWGKGEPTEDIPTGGVPPKTGPTGKGGGGTGKGGGGKTGKGTGQPERPLTREEEVAAAKERPFDQHAQDAIDEHRALQESKEEHGPHGHFYDNAFKGAPDALYADRALQEALGVDPNDKSAMGATHAALKKALNVESLTAVHPGEVADFLQQHDLGPGTPTWDKFGRSYRNYKFKELIPAKAEAPPAVDTTQADLGASLEAQGKGMVFEDGYQAYADMKPKDLRDIQKNINRLYGEQVSQGNKGAAEQLALHRDEISRVLGVPKPRGKGKGPPVEGPEAPAEDLILPADIHPGARDDLHAAIGHLVGLEKQEDLTPLQSQIRTFFDTNEGDNFRLNRAIQGYAKGVDALERYGSLVEGVTPQDVWNEVEDAHNAGVSQAEVAGGRYRKGVQWGNLGESVNTSTGTGLGTDQGGGPTRYVGPRGTTIDEPSVSAPGVQSRTKEGARVQAIRASPQAFSGVKEGFLSAYDRKTAERGQGAFNVAKIESSAARLQGTYTPRELEFARAVAANDTTQSKDAKRLTLKKIDAALAGHVEAVETARKDVKAGRSVDELDSAHSAEVLQSLLQSKKRLSNKQKTTIEAALYRKGELPEAPPGLEMALLPGTNLDDPISPENFSRLVEAAGLSPDEVLLISHGPEMRGRADDARDFAKISGQKAPPQIEYPKDEPFSVERLMQLREEANAKAGYGAHVFTGRGGELSVFLGTGAKDNSVIGVDGVRHLSGDQGYKVLAQLYKRHPDLFEVVEKAIRPDGSLRLTTDFKEFQKGRAGEFPPEKPWQTERRHLEEKSGMRVTPARGDQPPSLYISRATKNEIRWPEGREGQLLDKAYVDKLVAWASETNKPAWVEQLNAARGPDGSIAATGPPQVARSPYEIRGTVLHEGTHQLVNEMDLHGPETLDWFKKHPLYDKLQGKFYNTTYAGNPHGQPEEVLAFILGKQGGARPGGRTIGEPPPPVEYTKGGEPIREQHPSKLYLGLSHEEQVQYLNDLIDHVGDLRGPEALQKIADGVRSPRFRAEILDHLESVHGIETTATRERGAELERRLRAGSAGAPVGREGGAEQLAEGVGEALPERGLAPEPGGERTAARAGGAGVGPGVGIPLPPAGGGAGLGGGGGIPGGATGGGAAGGGVGGPPPAGAGAPGISPSPATSKGWLYNSGQRVINLTRLMRPLATLAHVSVFGKQIIQPLLNHPFTVGPKAAEGFAAGFSGKRYNDLLAGYSLGKYMEWGRQSGLSREGEAANGRLMKQISAHLEKDGVSRKDIHDLMDVMAGHHNPDQMPFISQLPVIDELKHWAESRGIKKFNDLDWKSYIENLGNVDPDEVMAGPEAMKGPLGWLAKTSKHSYIASKDAARFTMWAKWAEMAEKSGETPTSNPELFKNLANMANSVTGRGEFKSETLNKLVNQSAFLFWSTRYMKSRIDYFNPRRYFGKEGSLGIGTMEPLAAKINRREGAQFFAMQAAMLGGLSVLAKELGDKAGVSEVGLDPTNDRIPFGTFKFKGRRWEVPGGFVPYVRWAAKEAVSAYHYETGTQTRDEKNPGRIAWEFWRNKLSPAASLAADIATHETFRGEHVGVKDYPKAILQRYLPFVIDDLWSDVNEYKDAPPEAKPSFGATAVGTVARMLGEQNYPTTGKPSKMQDVHADTPLGLEQIRSKINTPHPTRKYDPAGNEPLDKFNIRRQREEEWWPKYGTALVKHPEWSQLTTLERRDALNSLRYRVQREGSLEEPNEESFDAETIIDAVRSRELSKEETAHTRLWTPSEMPQPTRSGY
jgi:hypothetical protein